MRFGSCIFQKLRKGYIVDGNLLEHEGGIMRIFVNWEHEKQYKIEPTRYEYKCIYGYSLTNKTCLWSKILNLFEIYEIISVFA